MLLKLLQSLVVSAAILFSASPMVPASMSTDNGGTKLAIDAYSDGGGVLIINQSSDTQIDNSSMNKLVFKYGDAAKSSNTTLKNQVNVLSAVATAIEKAAATTSLETAKLVINPPVNGAQCDDGISTTSGDVWQNGTCAGPYIDGAVCNDNSTMTYNDKYMTGACTGTYAISCSAIKTALPSATDGVYQIDPDGITGNPAFNAYCDMTTTGGGWTRLAVMPNKAPMSENLIDKGLTFKSIMVEFSDRSNRKTASFASIRAANTGLEAVTQENSKVMLGMVGGYGIYNTSQLPCNWQNSSGMIGAAYDAAQGCGTMSALTVGLSTSTSPWLTAYGNVHIYIK